jgi:predicted enzyme related to lactoylglutathione lyase
MFEDDRLPIGTVGWCDLTVPDATEVMEFYRAVVGWDVADVAMGDYADYMMHSPGDPHGVAGICHARGLSADLPAQWLVYIVVDDVDRAAERCCALGGEIVAEPRVMAGGRFCVVRDPAGAVCALWTPPVDEEE